MKFLYFKVIKMFVFPSHWNICIFSELKRRQKAEKKAQEKLEKDKLAADTPKPAKKQEAREKPEDEDVEDPNVIFIDRML